MKDTASSVIVGVADNNYTRGGHILHEQEYEGHGTLAIPDEVCAEIRREPGQPEIQQEPVVYLLLEGSLGWEHGLPGLPVPASPQPSQPAYRSGAVADPGYAPQRFQTRYGGTVAPLAPTGIYPPPGEPLARDAETGVISTSRKEAGL